MKSHFAALVMIALGAASNMVAGSVIPVPTGPQDFTYDLSLPSITLGTTVAENDSVHFDVDFSWLGPEMFNAADNTECPLGCPVTGTTPGSPSAGFSFSGIAFTASTAEDCATAPPADGCGEVIVRFANTFGASITYTLIEPDSFWATGGGDTFAAGDGVGSGASWIFQTPALELPGGDPPCTSCSVTTTITSAAPEPGTWLLLAGGMAAAILVARRRSVAAPQAAQAR